MFSLHFLIPIIEITILWIILNYLLKLFWGTRAMDAIFGFLAFLLLSLIANWFEFPVLEKIMRNIVNVAVIALIIIFQPELRLVLSKLKFIGKKAEKIDAFDKFLESLSLSVYKLSEKQIGALVVLENQDSHENYSTSFVNLNAHFSSELLESIFMTKGTLHDGALIIRGGTITAAKAILPLAYEGTEQTKALGTRHRAALGTSQRTDGLVIVVSEESGKVSIARDGIMTGGVKMDRFKGIVRSLFGPEDPKPKKRFSFFS